MRECLLKHLTVCVSSVLLGVKPSVLTGLPSQERCCGANFLDTWKENKKYIVTSLGISCKELKTSSNGKQVLFFNKKNLWQALRVNDNAEFLDRFGYLNCFSVEDYLKVLEERFNSRNFPHEIGVFLGYPLKDVKGFIYKESDPLQGATRWKVFGDSSHSFRLMQLYDKAENVFRQMIEKGQDPLRSINKLITYFQKESTISAVSIYG
jgi:hypothetical protein